MADVRGDENLRLLLTGNDQLAIGQRSGRERRVDMHTVSPALQPGALVVREAETPTPTIVGRDVRYCVRLLRKREQVLLQLIQGQPGINGFRVADHVQIVVSEIHYPPAGLIFNPG